MRVVRRREPLRAVSMAKTGGSGQQNDGTGVLTRLFRSNFSSSMLAVAEGAAACGVHWQCVNVVRLCGCGLSVFPVELTRLPLLEKLNLDNNKLALLPAEVGELRSLKVLRVDYNMLASVPMELRQCVGLVELSLEHNKLIRPLLDFRFSQFFVSPLMKIEAMERELQSIDSEFNQVLQNDFCRLEQLQGHTATPGHPFNNFSRAKLESMEIRKAWMMQGKRGYTYVNKLCKCTVTITIVD